MMMMGGIIASSF